MEIRITVADVVYPAPGKKQGKVIDQTGKEWQVWGDKMSGYQRGANYIITKYKTSDFKGKTYYTIEEVQPAAGGLTQAPQHLKGQVSETPIKLQMAPNDMERRLDIFTCGIMNNWAANPNTNLAMYSEDDIVALVNRLKKVWIRSFGRNSDMNDRLPDGM